MLLLNHVRLATLSSRFPQRIAVHYQNLRVRDWRAYFGIGSLGFLSGLGEVSEFDLRAPLLFLITSSLYLAFSFSINNCFDVRNDRGKGQNPIALGLIGFREGAFVSSILASIGILFTYLWLNPVSFYIYILLLVLSFTYSAPPLRLKGVPVADLISHGLFFGSLLFLYGASVGGDLLNPAVMIVLPLFIHSAALNLRNHLDDFDGDMMAATKTTALWLGRSRASKVLQALIAVHWIALGIVTLCFSLQFSILINSAALLIFLILRRYVGPIRATDVCFSLIYASTISYLVVL